MYGQEPIRFALRQYCLIKGVKYCHVAEQIQIHKSTLCHFLNKDRDMRKNNFNKLVTFLQREGFLK